MKPTFKVTTQCSKTEEVVKEQVFDNYKDAKTAYIKEKNMEVHGYTVFWGKVVTKK